jgi:O-antigen ligase
MALVALNVALGGSVKRMALGFAGSILLVGATAFAFRELIVERIVSLVAREGVSVGTLNAISRPAIWLHYVQVARVNRFIGTGLFTAENFGPVQFTTAGASATTTVRAPTENGYLAILVEQRLIGLALITIVIGGACVRGISLARLHKDHPNAVAAGLAAVGASAILVGNLTVNDFANDTSLILLGVFVGIILVASRQLGSVRTIRGSQ